MDLPFGSEIPKLDVLIVGAGLSGLTSGVKILDKDNSLNMKIIDERPPGGLIRGVDKRAVNKEQTEMINFLNQLNVILNKSEVPKDISLKRCWDLDRGLLSIPVKFELQRYIQMLELRMKKFQSLRVSHRERAPTMERHICYHLFFSQSRQFMFNMVEISSGMPASEITYDEFMGQCSSCGGLSVFIDMYFNPPQSTIDVSCQRLLEALLEKLRVIDISSNEKAIKIRHYRDYVEVITAQGEPYTAQAVILAMPWDKITEMQFDPPLPAQFANVLRPEKEPKRFLTQYYMRYNKSYWVSRGYSGQFMNSKPMMVGNESRPAEYGGYILHSKEEQKSVKKTVIELLAKSFGEEMLEPLEYKQETIVPHVVLSTPLINPWFRIIWSGSSVAAVNNRNLMGGAVESGLRAAISALYVVRPQVVSWRDLKDVGEKKRSSHDCPNKLTSLFSRFNLYNITFYGVLMIGLIVALNIGYSPPI
ncbi:hypothetical protein KR222_002430 [Zaprionus bogoriensis]|nr:hypothetical protein KR222_002430 [Zaprionus bogoriensis]